MPHTCVSGVGIPKYAYGSFKMLDLALPQIYTRVFHSWKSVALENAWDGDSLRTLAFLVWGSESILTGLFKNARFGPPLNLHVCFSLVEVCRFEECLGWR